MILKSCSSVVSVKSNTTLATESTQSSSMALTLSNGEQTIPPPELLSSLEEDGHKLDTCKQKLFRVPLSQKRRKTDKNTSLVDSELNEDSLEMQSDEVTKTAISGDTIATDSTPYSVNMIECTPDIYVPRKSKSTLPKNLQKLKTLVRNDTPPCSGSDITQQSLVSNPTGNNSASFVVQETSNEEVTQHSDIKNTVSSREQVFKNKTLTESGAAGPSQTRSNDKNPMKSKSDCRSRKRFKISVPEAVDLEWVGSPNTSKVDADKDPCTVISPTPSPKPAVSQELDHQSPIQYLSLETYSSEEESEDEEPPSKTKKTVQQGKSNTRELADMFRPYIPATYQASRMFTSQDTPGESIFSLETILNEEHLE